MDTINNSISARLTASRGTERTDHPSRSAAELPEVIIISAQHGLQVFTIPATSRYASSRLVSQSRSRATSDLDALRTDYAANPDCTFGIATGEDAGILALDITPGYSGLADEICASILGDPSSDYDWRTLTIRANDAYIALYQYPCNRPTRARKQIAPGLLMHGTDGWVTLPPAAITDGSGTVYINPGLPIRTLPDVLSELLLGPLPKDDLPMPARQEQVLPNSRSGTASQQRRPKHAPPIGSLKS